MTTISRPTELDRLRAAACTDKVALAAKTARGISRYSHEHPEENHGPVEAYRCPFASEHDDPTLDYHVGHAVSFDTLVWMARVLRARSGNAPGPVRRTTRVRRTR